MEDVRQRGNTVSVDVNSLNGGASPMKVNRSLLQRLYMEAVQVMADPQTKKICTFGVLNVLATIILLFYCNTTNSMALTAFTYLTIFDIFSLLTCLVSIWVKTKRPSQRFSFGYERFEVLAVFSSTLLAQLGALFVLKESIERMVEQPDIHEGRLLVGTAVAFFIHILVSYGIENKAFSHVVLASSSSWLQEHVTDMSESVCNIIPGMSKLLLPRLNPFALIGTASAGVCVITYFLIDVQNYHASDTWAAVWIALMTSGTMFPMSVYAGKILLQTTPSHMITQLDKSLREASTLDGVLEFRNEHFWTLHFGAMAGSVHVRIRRDANEQMVLAHVYHRLSNLVSVLTVQVFKDDWNRPNTFQILGDTSLFNKGITPPGTTTGTGSTSTPPQLNSPQQSNSSPYTSLNSSFYNNPSPGIGPAPSAATSLNYNNGGASVGKLNIGNANPTTNINMNKLNADILNFLGSTTAPSVYSSGTSGSSEQSKAIYSVSGLDTSKTAYYNNSVGYSPQSSNQASTLPRTTHSDVSPIKNLYGAASPVNNVYSGVNPDKSLYDSYSTSQLSRTEPDGANKSHFS